MCLLVSISLRVCLCVYIYMYIYIPPGETVGRSKKYWRGRYTPRLRSHSYSIHIPFIFRNYFLAGWDPIEITFIFLSDSKNYFQTFQIPFRSFGLGSQLTCYNKRLYFAGMALRQNWNQQNAPAAPQTQMLPSCRDPNSAISRAVLCASPRHCDRIETLAKTTSQIQIPFIFHSVSFRTPPKDR